MLGGFIGWGLACLFAVWGVLYREKYEKINKKLPENIKRIYLDD